MEGFLFSSFYDSISLTILHNFTKVKILTVTVFGNLILTTILFIRFLLSFVSIEKMYQRLSEDRVFHISKSLSEKCVVFSTLLVFRIVVKM